MLRSFVFFVSVFLTIPSAQAQESLLQAFEWRSIGPANLGGRVVDIEAYDADFTHVYLASASGGVFKSENAGTTWEPIFDDYEAASIGDIAVFQPDPNIIWVGTGEANNRNSVSWGNGVYVSRDAGASFEHVGLSETHHIARIQTHPSDPNIAYVCAIGHLWGYSGTRGLYLTRNGGASWELLAGGLPKDGKTGCTDLVMDPRDPNVLYSAFYHRLRRPWTFHSGGPNGGIFKSTDGGVTWTKLTEGLPPGDTGRIGLAIYRANPDIVMALVEAEQTGTLDRPGSGVYRSEDAGASWTYVNTYNNRPFYYSQIRINPHDDQRVYLLTTRFMVSEDGGETLRNGSEDQEIHGDFHAMWLDPMHPDRYYIGADKGASITYDHGEHFQLFDNLSIGQFYRIGVDMRDPYVVYGGTQDNGTFAVPSFTRDARGMLNDDNWKLHWGDGQHIQIDPNNWRKVYTQMENGNSFRYDALTYEIESMRPRAGNIENYTDIIPPGQRQGGAEFRFNWSAPLVMSPHDAQTLYAAGNHIFETTNGGHSWRIISPDITTNHPVKTIRGQSGGLTPDNSGAEHHGSATTLSVSPLNPEVIWVGTDDGNVQITTNRGETWTNRRQMLPPSPDSLWVSRIEASHFHESRAYITYDGHRSDNFEPWVFRTDDYGQTWTSLRNNLPETEVIRVIREDLHNPNLLFIGTETGVWVSLDAGESWKRFMPNMPTVSVLDLVIHPRDNDLIAGTHGRGFFIMDDISPLQQLGMTTTATQLHAFEDQPVATQWKNTSRGGQRGHFWFAGQNPPEIENRSSLPRVAYRSTAAINYLLVEKSDEATMLTIRDPEQGLEHSAELPNEIGIQRYRWDMSFEPQPLTAEQRDQANEAFRVLMSRTSSPTVQRAYEAFQRANNARAERRALTILTSGYFDVGLGSEFKTPIAGPGKYEVILTRGEHESKATLVVREDPLISE